MIEPFDVAVVGAGVTGLAAAWAAERQGATVALLEADSECGGAIKSKHIGGFLIECGATSMSGSAELETVLRQLSLQHDVLEPPRDAARRFIVRNGKLRALPSSPFGVVTTSALSVRGKLRAILEPWVQQSTLPAASESIANLIRRRFGDEVLDYVVDPFISGVYAGDPEKLSSRFALRTLSELEREHGSIVRGLVKRSRQQRASKATMQSRPHTNPIKHDESEARQPSAPRPILTFRHGLQQLPRSIEQALTGPVRYNERLTGVTYADGHWQVTSQNPHGTRVIAATALILALPAHQLSAVTWPAALGRELRAVRSVVHAPVATVSVGFRRNQVAHPLNGFGALVPHKEPQKILGVLFNSTMFAGRAPHEHVLLTCFVGGARHGEPLTGAGAEQSAVRELAPLLGITGRPVLANTNVWSDGIPQCNLGTEVVGQSLERAESAWPGLFFSGSYRSGVAVAECLSSGLQTGARAAAVGRSRRANAHGILAEAGHHSL